MKIGRNKTSLVISLTEREHDLLGKHQAAKVSFNLGSIDRWIVLEGSSDGFKIAPASNDAQHPVRVELYKDKGPKLDTFATEQVKAWSPSPGILCGHAPAMDKPLMRQSRNFSEHNIAPLTQMPGLDELKQAVVLINNFKRQYGSQLEISIEADGQLRVRMMLEL